MIADLWLPILLSTAALFFASFVFWMIIPLHKGDWNKLPNEDDFLDAVRRLDIKPGNYMFPGAGCNADMQTEDFKEKLNTGPRGIITVFASGPGMGKNLGLTVLYFLVTSFAIAYLTTLASSPDWQFADVFRFAATAGIMTFLPAILMHSAWFENRITGHIIESIAFAAIVAAILGGFWPDPVPA